jgi:hypothetical protein
MPLDPLPDPPSTSDPSNFADKSDALLGALPDFVTQANALEANVESKEASAVAAAAAAATSEANAASSEAAAANSESNAAASEAAAAASAAAAAASFDSFDDRYLGAKTSDPATDNDGNALIDGAQYFNTTISRMKYYTGSQWNVAFADAADVTYTPSGTGAVATTSQDKMRQMITSFDFMTEAEKSDVRAGTYSMNVGTALQKAIDEAYAKKVPLALMGGGYLHSGLTFYPGQAIIGAGSRFVMLKLAANANTDVLKSENAYTWFGTNTSSGTNGWYITGVTLDGNRANQSPSDPDTCNGIAYYGAAYTLRDVVIQNIKGHGIRSEWYQFGENTGGIEALIDNVHIDTVGRHGWWFKGPHDHDARGVIVIDASQETDNTYSGIYCANYGTGRFYNCHTWHRSATTNRMQWGFSSNGSNEIIGCHFEGGRGQLQHRGNADRVDSCHIYGHSGSAGTAMVELGGNENQHSNCRYANTTSADCYAIKFANSASGNRIEGYFSGFQTRSPFNFSSDGGLNEISASGFASSGGATSFGGTVASNTRVTYEQGGTAISKRPVTYFPAGSASFPGAAVLSDTDTGIAQTVGANSLSLVTAGIEALTVDSSQRVGIGTVSPSRKLQVRNDSGGSSLFMEAHGTSPFRAEFFRTRASDTDVQSGDGLGTVGWVGQVSNTFPLCAQVRAEVDGAPSASNIPSRITMVTMNGGVSTEGFRLDSSGQWIARAGATTIVDSNGHLGLRSYTTSTLPSASPPDRMISVSNGTSNKRLAISDGTNFRFPDGNIVS